jgi:hypothetical protein
VCGQSFKKNEFLKNHHGNTIYQNFHVIFEINSYTFKVETTKKLWKFTMFQKFICLKHWRKACGQVVFLFQKAFFLIKCLSNRFNFIVNFNIFHKKGSMCSKFSKNKNTYTFFRFWYSNIFKQYYSFEFAIMVQSKVIDLTIMWGLMPKKLSFCYVICHIWHQIWYLIWKIVWKMHYKPKENFHVKNAILGKNFNFGATNSFFHAFTLPLNSFQIYQNVIMWYFKHQYRFVCFVYSHMTMPYQTIPPFFCFWFHCKVLNEIVCNFVISQILNQ